MKKLRILKNVLARTHADRILLGFVLFILIDALIITLWEPGIDNYLDALWYCYAVISTTGFGDVVVVTFIGKAMSVLLTIYSVLVIAIVTGVIVNYYTQIIQIQQQDTITAFVNKLEHLPELTKEELEELSRKVSQFKAKRQE